MQVLSWKFVRYIFKCVLKYYEHVKVLYSQEIIQLPCGINKEMIVISFHMTEWEHEEKEKT